MVEMSKRICQVTSEPCPCELYLEVDCRDCPTWENRNSIQISRFQGAINKKLDEILKKQMEILDYIRRIESNVKNNS
jgi:hypothetical protein